MLYCGIRNLAGSGKQQAISGMDRVNIRNGHLPYSGKEMAEWQISWWDGIHIRMASIRITDRDIHQRMV